MSRTKSIRWRLTAPVAALVIGGLAVVGPARSDAAFVSSLGYDPTDLGSMSSVAQMVGATQAWASGYTGKGVDVALIDTGVTQVTGIASNQIIDGPDLSFDAQNGITPGADTFGHGTYMAGIIAGHDPNVSNSNGKCATCVDASGYSDANAYMGIAPDARILNMKVGAYDGSVDVTQVIAAINWVVQHRTDNGMNIKIINLSYGTTSNQAYGLDPLAYAAEQAWKAGILVVAAAGNDGVATTDLASPAYDPFVVAVGADDPNGTLSPADDVVPAFANHGNNLRKVDFIAPAVHIIGLNVPGSFVDQNYAATGGVGTRFIRGSGTSQAAAVTSGVAALLYQKFPTATPDQMRKLLFTTATPLPAANATYRGHGRLNAANGLAATLTTYTNTGSVPATGTGTIDASRGTTDRLAIGATTLTGEIDIFGTPLDTKTLAASTKTRASWNLGTWNSKRWTADGWNNGRWSQTQWDSPTWAGTDWTDPSLTNVVWDGSHWSGSHWSGSHWSGSHWSGSHWSGSHWSDNDWT